MITFQGGKCQLRLDRYCTHLIVGKASGNKYEIATKYNIQIVTPDWVTESSKKRSLLKEPEFHPRLLMYSSPNSSTALITGFMDEDALNNSTQEEQEETNAVLEQLKQRMPWNQPNQHNLPEAVNSASVFQTANRNVGNQQQQQQHFVRSVAVTTSSSPVVSQNLMNQNWIPANSQANNLLQMKSPLQNQMQDLQNQQLNEQNQVSEMNQRLW